MLVQNDNLFSINYYSSGFFLEVKWHPSTAVPTLRSGEISFKISFFNHCDDERFVRMPLGMEQVTKEAVPEGGGGGTCSLGRH